jgi:hypothetical protein
MKLLEKLHLLLVKLVDDINRYDGSFCDDPEQCRDYGNYYSYREVLYNQYF